MAHTVFISYSADDTEVAEAICSTLESRGIKCWMAPRNVLPGQHWGEAIIDAISETQLVVVIISSYANASTQVLREVERAANKDVPIVTFRIENVPLTKSLEYYLSSYHWLDACTPPLEKHLQRLADAVQVLVTSKYGAQFQPALVEETDARKPVDEKRAERVGEKKKPPVPVEKSAEKRKVLAKSVWFWAGVALLCTGLGILVLFMMKWFCIPVIILGLYCLRRGWAEGHPPKPAVVRVKPPSQVEKPAEARRVLVPPLPVAKKQHPVWFWLGLLLFVTGLGVVFGFLGIQVGSGGKAGINLGAILVWNLPFALLGILLLWLSKRRIRHWWFWPGAVMFSGGLAASPAMIYNMNTYSNHTPSAGEFVAGIGIASVPFIISGAFCLWKGWPRTGVKHPRGEVSGFLTAMCLICLAFSLLLPASGPGEPGEKDILSFSDNFEDGVANGWNLDSGWAVTLDGGNYVLEGQGQGYQWARPQVTEATAYILDADFKLLSSILRFDAMLSEDHNNRYAVEISQGYLQLFKGSNNQWLSLDEGEANITLGQWYHVKIVVGGNITAIYLDGELKLEYWDEQPLSSGSFAIETCKNAHAFVDNIVVGPNTYSTPQLLHILSFSDNFEDGVANGWNLESGWAVTLDGGNYVLEGQGQDFQRAQPRVTEATAYILEADFKLLGGSLRFGTMLSQDKENRYAVEISQGYLELFKGSNNQQLSLDGCQANITLGQWYHIKIEAGGNITAVYLGGELKLEYWDENPLPSGSFGVATCENSHALIDNIVVGPNTYSTPQLLHILSFSDNFDDGIANGWSLDTGWAVTLNGTNHVLEGQGQDFQRAWPRVTQAENYTLEADFMLLSGFFEINPRHSNTEQYNVWIYNNVVNLGKERNSKVVDLVSADVDIGFNQWHKAEVAVKGGNLRVFIDGNLEIDYWDNDPIYQGSFWFMSHPNSHVWLDNIAVKPY